MLVQLDDEERFQNIAGKWNGMRMGVKMRISEVRQKEDRVSHMIFADNCYLFAKSKEQISKMLLDATEELSKRGLDWKEDQMEMISRGFRKKSWRSAY